jgi:predicted ATPase
MHLQRLKIREFRNLRDFEITFTAAAKDADGVARDFKSHAVIGQNGSGKSNMIEAIVTIFRDLDLKKKTEFDYELDYWCRGNLIRVKSVENKVEVFDQDLAITLGVGTSYALSHLSSHADRYLPKHVFAYYSGRNERIEALFLTHQRRFYKALLDGEDEPLRRLFYCRSVHSQFVLLAYLLREDAECRRILKGLGIVELDSVLFVLKNPYWFKGKPIKNGDPRFWYARGVVKKFLGQLWSRCISPIDWNENRVLDFRDRKEELDLLYLFLPDKEALQKLANDVGDTSRFFKHLESTYISDLIDEVRINVKHSDVEGNLTFTQLSEGQQQFLTVLGLMRFTHEDESLFLLDEPDTHLNPIWKLSYFEEIDRVVKLQNASALASSQLIITTHDPLMIGSLRKEQVRIMRSEGGKTTVDTPEEHPQGMGVAGLLKSELFGLSSTLDSYTLKKLQERNELLALRSRGKLSTEQETRLKSLRDGLDDLGFSREYRDPLYQLFIQKMYEVRSQPLDNLLTAQEKAEQESLAEQIVAKIVKTEKTDELSALARELKIAVTK